MIIQAQKYGSDSMLLLLDVSNRGDSEFLRSELDLFLALRTEVMINAWREGFKVVTPVKLTIGPLDDHHTQMVIGSRISHWINDLVLIRAVTGVVPVAKYTDRDLL